MLGTLIGYGLLFNCVGAAATSSPLPNLGQLVWLILAGVFTAGGQLLQLLAAKYAPANRIAPTHYSQIVWTVILGALFFQEYPDRLSLVGLAGGRRLRTADDDARTGEALHRALGPVHANPALSWHRSHKLRGDRGR